MPYEFLSCSRQIAGQCTLSGRWREVLLCLIVSIGGTLAPQVLLASTATERTANIAQSHQSLSSAEPASVKHKNPIKLVVSMRPLALILDELIPKESRLWQRKVLVSPQASPHDYQLRPSDLASLKQAKGFFWLGEKAAPQFNKAVQRSGVKSLALSKASLDWLSASNDEDSLHHHHHHHSGVDPHIWLSLPQIPNILRFYSQSLHIILDGHAKDQQWDERRLVSEKDALDTQLKIALGKHAQIQDKLKQLSGTWVHRSYISFHDAFAYLDKAFGIKSKGSFVRNPEDGISPRQIRRLQTVIADEELGCLFTEPAADGRDIERLIQKKVPVVDLDILASSLPSGVDLTGFWEYMLEQAQSCFGGSEVAPASIPASDESTQLRPIPKDEKRILEKLKQWTKD